MKWFFVLIFIGSLVACQKSIDISPNGTNDSNNCQIAGSVQGTGDTAALFPDTVYLYQYDEYNRLSQIIDSNDSDSLITISYIDTSDYMQSLKGVFNVTFLYDSANLLTGYDDGTGNSWVLEYDSTNRPVKKSMYYNSSLYRYFTYEFNSDGDIATIKEYSPANELLAETNYTYTENENIYKQLCLLSVGNALGFDDVFNTDFYFNKHLVKSYSNSGENVNINYTFDAKNNLTNFVTSGSNVNSNSSYVFTRQFTYTCK